MRLEADESASISSRFDISRSFCAGREHNTSAHSRLLSFLMCTQLKCLQALSQMRHESSQQPGEHPEEGDLEVCVHQLEVKDAELGQEVRELQSRAEVLQNPAQLAALKKRQAPFSDILPPVADAVATTHELPVRLMKTKNPMHVRCSHAKFPMIDPWEACCTSMWPRVMPYADKPAIEPFRWADVDTQSLPRRCT